MIILQWIFNIKILKMKHKLKSSYSKVQEINALLVSDDVKIEFELELVNEVYKENVEIGEKISFILHRGIFLENSLSKQSKFCLELSRTQKPTIKLLDSRTAS